MSHAHWIDSGVATQVRSALEEALSSGEPGGAPAALDTLLEHLNSDQRPADGRRVKPFTAPELNRLRGILQRIADVRYALNEQRIASDQLRIQKAALLDNLNLSQAVIAAYAGKKGAPSVRNEAGHGALSNWTMWVRRCSWPASDELHHKDLRLMNHRSVRCSISRRDKGAVWPAR